MNGPLADVVVLGLKAALVVGAAALVARALAGRSAAARHMVWTGALGVLILLPAAAPVAPAVSLRVLPRYEAPAAGIRPTPLLQTAASSTAAEESRVPSAVAGASPWNAHAAGARVAAPDAPPAVDARATTAWIDGRMPSMSVQFVVAGTWLAGAFAIVLRFFAGLAAAVRLVRTGTAVVSTTWQRELAAAAERLGVAAPPALVASPDVSVPVTIGLFASAIVLPIEALAWPEGRIRVVLLHELAHIRRRDAFVQCLQHAACALHWWNPLVWHASRRLTIERERACDDIVLEAGMPGTDYASHLVDIARQALGRRPLAAAALAMARPSELEGRVMAMLDSRRIRGRVTRRMLTGAAAGVLATAGLVASVRLEPRLSAAVLPHHEAVRQDMIAASQGTPAPKPAAQRSGPQSPAPAQPKPAAQPTQPKNPEQPVQEVEGVRGGVKGGVRGGAARKKEKGPGEEISQATRESVTAALMTALGDKNPDVRKQALFALSHSPSPQLVDPMMKALSDADPDVRQQAAFGLGQMGDVRAVPGLISVLDDTEVDVRAQAAFALGQIGSDTAIEALTSALSDKEPDVRAQVVFALGQIGSPKTVDALKKALSDVDDDVRAQAASALGHMLSR